MPQKLPRLRQWNRKLEKKKIPKGAIHFPFLLKHELNWKEIDSFRQKFNVGNIFVVHGVAFRKGNTTTLVSGPPAIGKSTGMRTLAGQGTLQPIDDGNILLGFDKTAKKYFVFETGCYPIIKTQSVVSKITRKAAPFKNAYTKPNLSDKRFNRADKIGKTVSSASLFLGRILSRNRSTEEHEPKKFCLNRIILASHPKMDPPVFAIEGHKTEWQGFRQLRSALSKQAEIVPFEPTQKDSRKKLNKLMAQETVK